MSHWVKLTAAAGVTMACIATAFAQGAQQGVQLQAYVPSSCTLGGTSTPSALNMSIPIDGAGNVNTAQQTFVVTQVVCTTSATIMATSMNGGVKSATNPGSAFTNIINYKSTVQYGKAKSTLNTATIPTANASESGTSESTGSPQTGALVIRVTPLASTLPLAGGSDYSDTLRITLLPD
jgi:hypothetical protein